MMPSEKAFETMYINKYPSLTKYRYTVFGFVHSVCSEEVFLVFHQFGSYEDLENNIDIKSYIEQEMEEYGSELSDRNWYDIIIKSLHSYTCEKLSSILESEIQYELFINKDNFKDLKDKYFMDVLDAIDNVSHRDVRLIGDDVSLSYLRKVNTGDKKIIYVTDILNKSLDVDYMCSLEDE